MSNRNSFKIIDFCNFKTSVITADIIKSSILEKIGSYIKNEKLKIVNSTDVSDSGKIPFKQYRLRTNGIKAYLYITNNNGRYYSYLIEQNSPNKVEIINCRLRLSPELYSGTLFYGELVLSKKKTWDFLIINTLLVNGIPAESELNLDKVYRPDPILQFLELKTDYFRPISEIDGLNYSKLMNANYCYIGIEFIMEDSSKRIIYFNNFDSFVQSDTPDTAPTKIIFQDFYITPSKRPDIYYLVDIGNPEKKFNNIPYIKQLEMSQLLREKTSKSTDKLKVKCATNKKFNKWEVIEVY
jgi:hypothetical protein